jgi:hypothetical protein
MPKSEDGAIYDCHADVDAEKTRTAYLHQTMRERFAELRSVLMNDPKPPTQKLPKAIRLKEANLPYGQQPGGDQ